MPRFSLPSLFKSRAVRLLSTRMMNSPGDSSTPRDLRSMPATPGLSAGLLCRRASLPFPALVCILVAAFLTLVPCSASAQVTYGGDSVIASGFGNPSAIAEDKYGDIFVYDSVTGSISWFAPDSSGKYSTIQTISTGIGSVESISVDALGGVLFEEVVTESSSLLYVYYKNGGTYSLLETVNPGSAAAFPVAVDSTANIAVADQNDSTLYFGNYEALPEANLTNRGNDALDPVNAAVVSPDDSVFLAGLDFGATENVNNILQFKQNGAVGIPDVAGALTNDSVESLALDGFSNLYAALPFQNAIDEIADTHDGIYTLSTTLTGSSTNGVASDRFGNLSHIDSSNKTLSVDVRYPAIDFGTVAVGSALTKYLFVTVNASSAIDAGVLIENLVIAPATADFLDIPLASTCSNPATNTWYCSVPVAFAPTEPGVRTDAMEIKSGGNVLTTVYLSGNATGSAGPQAYTSKIIGETGVPLNGVTIESATGVAADPVGNLYVLDQASLQIVKYTRGGPGAYSGSPLGITGLTLTTPGLNYIAVDAAGNIYTDQGTSIVKIDPSGQATTVPIGISLGAVSGLYADSYGMLHISDNVNGQVVMVPALGTAVVERSVSGAKFAGLVNIPGQFSTVNFLGTGAIAPFGPTYAVDTENQKIDEFGFPLAGFQYPGFDFAPRQMALDLNQNLIFANPATSAFVGYSLTALATFQLPVAPPEGCTPDSLIQTEVGDYVASASDCGEVIVYPASNVQLPPVIAASFAPSSIAFGGSSTLTITITNPDISALTGVGFTDNLPAGLSIGSTAFGNTCGQIVSASPNSASLNGVSIAAGTSCSVTIPIVPTEYGTFQDSTGVITSNEAGNGAAASATLTVTGSLPTVTGISPGTGVPTGGTAVTITGTNFDANSAAVNFGATPGTNVTVVSATKITATSPSGTGTVDVTVTTPSGTTATNPADQFTYVAPNFVVNTIGDDPSGIAGNCPAGGSAATCTLRDALAAASAVGSGNITFSSSVFNPAQTIVASDGTLNIPSLTTITGLTSGSGSSLQNLVTISGGSTSNGFSLFTVASGVAGASIANLTITNSGTDYAGGINNAGGLTVQSSTLTGLAGEQAGAIYNNGGTMEISDSTISGNTAEYGGGLYSASGTVTVIDSTISGNATVLGAGGILLTGGTVNVVGSTVAGNFAGLYGPGIYNTNGTLTVANSIVSGNQQGTQASPGNYDDIDDKSGDSTFTVGNGGGNLIGYYNANSPTAPTAAANLAPLSNYGGPTQTMVPQPGSSAICAASFALIPSGVTTDQRGVGFPNTNITYPGYSSATPCVDSGAVQTDYAISFSTEPPTSGTAQVALSPAPVVQLTESGIPATAASSSVSISGSPVVLGGTTTESLSSGAATFSNLAVPTATPSEILTATVALNSTLNLTATSTATSVTGEGTGTPATLASPTPSSTLTGPSATFTWSAVSGATVYVLSLGTTGPASSNVYYSGQTTATSVTANQLPTNGATIYARLFTNFNGTWTHEDYTFVAATQAALTTPAPSSTLAGPSVTFTWSAATGATGYLLSLGSTGAGSSNLYYSGQLTSTSTSVKALSANGETVFARLFTNYNGTWVHTDYTYTESTQAALSTPAPSTTLTGPNVTFAWSAATGATGYLLSLGSTGPGAADLYYSGSLTATSTAVNALPVNGETIYARLFTNYSGTWVHTDYTYSAVTGTMATMTAPAPGSALTSSSVTFTWTAATGATGYLLSVGTTGPGSYDLHYAGSASTSATVSHVPTNGETIYVRLFANYSGTWLHTDYTYTAAP